MGKRKQNVSCNRMHHSCFRSLALVSWVIFLTACTSLKKAALIGGGALVPGAIASVATSGTAPVLLASAVGASVTSVVADVMTPSKGGSMPTAASCAPDNFWTLLGDLVSMGGWLLILIFWCNNFPYCADMWCNLVGFWSLF